MTRYPRLCVAACAAAIVFGTHAAQAGQIASRAALNAILSDQLILEEFEGFSLPGGTSSVAANPLNATTAPARNLQAGATYASPTALVFYASATNVLAATSGSPNVLTLTFDQPQLAVGLDLVNITGGGFMYHETVEFLAGAATLGQFPLTLPSASRQFVGWQDAAGVTAVRLTSDSFAIIDDIAWGAAVPEPASGTLLALAGLLIRRRRA